MEPPPEGVEPPPEKEAQTQEPDAVSGAEPQSDLTVGITGAFKTFKTQLEEHFSVSPGNILETSWKVDEMKVLIINLSGSVSRAAYNMKRRSSFSL